MDGETTADESASGNSQSKYISSISSIRITQRVVNLFFPRNSIELSSPCLFWLPVQCVAAFHEKEIVLWVRHQPVASLDTFGRVLLVLSFGAPLINRTY